MKERRRERLASIIKEEMPLFFQDIAEINSGVFVSVLYVEVLEAGSKANVFVSVFPDDMRSFVAKTLKMLENKATHFLKTRLGYKFTPAIRFQIVENSISYTK